MDPKQPEKAIAKSDWALLALNLLLMVWFLVDMKRDGGNIVPWVVLSAGVVGFTSWAAWRKIRRSKV